LKKAEDRAKRDGGDLFERRLELERSRATAFEEVATADGILREVASGPLPLILCGELLESLAQSAANASGLEGPELSGLLATRDREVIEKLSLVLDAETLTLLGSTLAEDVEERVVALTGQGYHPSITATRMAAAAQEQNVSAYGLLQDVLARRAASLELVSDYERQLAGVPEEAAIAAVLEQRDELRELSAETRGRLGLLLEDQERAERDAQARRVELEKERQTFALQMMQGSDAVRVLEHANKVRETLEHLKDQVRERSISKIEEVVVDCFRELLGKQNFITKLELDLKTCEPTLTNKAGKKLHLERLSAGERQLFAISMLWGLAIVSGRQLPTIIDTPLGRLDSNHRFTLVDRYFPKAADQVILLSTDKEIDEELAARLEPSTGRWYRIDYENDRESSTISEGSLFEGADDVA
jgi:DNA sulfur modification protein DndD